ncbi:hypothetical protein KORDIASMS9_03722 [Kordia sp. SMS9]|nr:hypothetical protein KORDIASMS9_03722 [Kordia sp. SMS9]
MIVNAQDKDTKDKVLEDVTNDVCACISEKVDEGISQKDIEVQLGLCLINSYGKFKARIDKYMNVSFDDATSMEKFGQEIGMKMITVCPDTFMSFAKDIIEEEVENYNASDETTPVFTVVSGEAVKLVNDQFNVLSFKGTNKRMYKFLWLEYFEGQELLSDMKDLKKKQLEISFESIEMYDPKLKDYRTYKVLRKIEVVN